MMRDRIGGARGALAYKAPVKVATTASITLSGAQTIDGVSVVAGDRVLVKDQANGAQNGIWIAATGEWSRALDFDGVGDITQGTRVYVANGTVNGGRVYVLTTTDDPILVGMTEIDFASDANLLFGSTDLFGSFVESGVGTEEVKAFLSVEHDGPHASNPIDSMAIMTRPVGSGVNGPGGADYSLVLSNIKQNWADSGLAEQGEIDGLSIVIRQGGPAGGGSDCAGILVNAANTVDAGFICTLEATTTTFNNDLTVRQQSQFQANTHETISGNAYGCVVICKVGEMTGFYAATQTGAAFDFPFQYVDGTTKFSVDVNGSVYSASAYRTAAAAGNAACLHGYRDNTSTLTPDILIEQDGSGDAFIEFLLSGTRAWCLGIDNSDSDKFKLSPQADSFAAPVLEIATAGNASLLGLLRVGGIGTPAAQLHTYRDDASANISLLIEQDGSGDATMEFLLSGTRAWNFGIDNSDSDSLKMSPANDAFAGAVWSLTVAGEMNVAASYSVAGSQVLSARNTGWVAMTGSADKGSTYDTATVTLPQLAGRVMAIQAALTTHGTIGA